MKNPFSALTKYEWALYFASLVVIILSAVFSPKPDAASLTASLLGATALIFVAKGHPFGQIMTVVFAAFYGWISFTFRYWGEMITYLGMTAPIAIAATVAWLRNPYEKGKSEVKIARLSAAKFAALVLSTVAVTVAFYFILAAFDTPNLLVSTVSIATSFLASALTFFRSPYYALAYAANDVVLIVLWVLASLADAAYIPMIACFVIFLANDMYGFYNWKRMQKKQAG